MKKSERIDLGLEILMATRQRGRRYTHREIAAYCDCTWSAIWQIEQGALHKLKRALYMRDDPILRELIESVKSA